MRICARLAKTKLQISCTSIFSVHKCIRKNAWEETQAPRRKPSRAGRDSEIFPHYELPHYTCSAIGRDPVSLCVQLAVVYRYRKWNSFPRSPGPGGIFAWSSHLFSRTEWFIFKSDEYFLKDWFKILLSITELRGGVCRTQCTHQFFRHKFPRFVRRVTVLQS
jgi:hypothetical protein